MQKNYGESFVSRAGVPVILTDHACDRVVNKKRGAMTDQQLNNLLEEVAAYVKVQAFEPTYYNEEVFFYSRHFQRGCIVAFRRDFKGRHKGTCLVLITVYPYGKSRPLKAGTERVVM